MEYLRVQLKVCEGCGGLWFRTQNVEEKYGRCCAGKLAQHAMARLEQRRTRPHARAVTAGGAA
jgi:hypothetical protein